MDEIPGVFQAMPDSPELVELFFGEGCVSVGIAQENGDVVLALGDLPEAHNIGEQLPLGTGRERVRLYFSNVRSINVVLGALRALRTRLLHQCRVCGEYLGCSGGLCVRCGALESRRLAEPASLASRLRAFVHDHEAFIAWRQAWEISRDPQEDA